VAAAPQPPASSQTPDDDYIAPAIVLADVPQTIKKVRERRELRIGCGFTLSPRGTCTVVASLDRRTARKLGLGGATPRVPIAAGQANLTPAGLIRLPIGKPVARALRRVRKPVKIRFDAQGNGLTTALRQTMKRS
jgi:hypothetical protein